MGARRDVEGQGATGGLSTGIRAFVWSYLRSASLWLIYPMGFLVFLVVRVVTPGRSAGIRPGMVIGWLDLRFTMRLLRLLRLPMDGLADVIEAPAWRDVRDLDRLVVTREVMGIG